MISMNRFPWSMNILLNYFVSHVSYIRSRIFLLTAQRRLSSIEGSVLADRTYSMKPPTAASNRYSGNRFMFCVTIIPRVFRSCASHDDLCSLSTLSKYLRTLRFFDKTNRSWNPVIMALKFCSSDEFLFRSLLQSGKYFC